MHLKNTLALAFCLVGSLLFGQSSYDIAIEHLQRSEQYAPVDLQDILISDEYESRHNGITHLYLKQRFQGIEVIGAMTNFNIKAGELRSSGGSFVKNLAENIESAQASITAEQALQQVMLAHSISFALPSVITIENTAEKKTTFEKGAFALEEIEARLVFLQNESEKLRLAWEIKLYELSADNWWLSYVDAANGSIVKEFNQVIHCKFHSNKNHSAKAKVKHFAEISILKNAMLVANSYNVFAYPVESPNHGDRTVEISPWNDAGDAGTLGWHDDGSSDYTHTRGNNVDAYEDQNNSNGPTGGNAARADGGDDLEFDFILDLNADPELDPDPYITNLFYWNNLMHDVWYQYGFDEPSGNFQEDNLGRGGSGSDYVRAEAQDGGGMNNANFSTPTDGGNPRMQMYLWSPGDAKLEVNAPDNVAGLYDMEPADFGGPLDPGTTGDVVEVDDGSGDPSLGCSALVNADDVAGNIALIDRGDCQFGTKCLHAQDAGAIAVLVCNNVSGLVTMAPGNDGDQVTIPAVMIRQSDCATIRQELNNGLNVTIEDIGNPPLDGDLDNGIIAHEYGHGISVRLTGGPSTNSCLNNSEQMGEGWSDWFGIWMTIEDGDNHADVRGVGTYALGENPTDDGIRPAPYTTDMNVNDYTYGNVDDSGISVPHGVGFIWCTMLWDLNWAMINEHGFDSNIYTGGGGNNITAQLVIDGLKLQPCSPGFVDGRDAILDADEDNNGSANYDIIWNVFARRGVGYSALQGSSGSRTDQTEAFDLPPEVTFMTDEELFGELPLPVELLSFNALPNEDENRIDLFWTTASENNNLGFEITRRSEQETSFEKIGWVEANSFTGGLANYSFYDVEVKPGVEYYYQLNQLDYDNRASASQIVTAKLNGTNGELEVYPNPSRGTSILKLSDNLKGTANLQILNTQGQVVGAQVFETGGGAELELNLEDLPEGIYFVQVEIDNEVYVKRVVLRK